MTVEATTTVTAPAGAVDVNAEIESAKQLVRDLKRELQLRAAAGDELEETGYAQAESSSRGIKRGTAEEGTSISSGVARGSERAIRTNRRVEEVGVGQTVKKAAFGAMLFGLGATAAMCVTALRDYCF
jgi:hypothetical protein